MNKKLTKRNEEFFESGRQPHRNFFGVGSGPFLYDSLCGIASDKNIFRHKAPNAAEILVVNWLVT